MTIKIGSKRYSAYIDDEDGKISIAMHVVTNIQNRKPFPSCSFTVKYGFMIQHEHGITWIKKSTKHKDWGYDTKCHPLYKTKFRIEDGLPYSATKKGALAKEIADTRKSLKDWGDDNGEGFMLNSELLKRLISAKKRCKV